MPPVTRSQLAQYAVLEARDITDQSAFLGMFKSVTGLQASYEVLEYAEGGNNDFVYHLPGRMSYPRLTLSWGMTIKSTLQDWFFQTHVKADLRDITLTIYGRQGGGPSSEKRTFVFADAYPVGWSGPSINGDSPASFAAWEETLEIVHSGLRLSS